MTHVQEVVAPLLERIRIEQVSSINDSGEFAVAGRHPVTGALVAFLITPRVGCRADFDGNGTMSIQDILDFLAAYFAACA